MKLKLVVQRKIVFWYVILKASNGETLMTSETYFSKSNAVRAGKALSRQLKVNLEYRDNED